MVQGSGHVMQLGCTAPQVCMVNDTYGLRKDLRMENTFEVHACIQVDHTFHQTPK